MDIKAFELTARATLDHFKGFTRKEQVALIAGICIDNQIQPGELATEIVTQMIGLNNYYGKSQQ